jgi:hypothetical protein
MNEDRKKEEDVNESISFKKMIFLIKEVREQNRQKQEKMIQASQRLRKLVDDINEPTLNKETIAETINDITSTTNSVIGATDSLFVLQLATNEKLNAIVRIICTLPGVVENKELVNTIVEKMDKFDNDIVKLREGLGLKQNPG